MRINNVSGGSNYGGVPPHGALSPSETTQVQDMQSDIQRVLRDVQNAQSLPSDQRTAIIQEAQGKMQQLQENMIDLLAGNKGAFSQAAPEFNSDLGYIQRDLDALIVNPKAIDNVSSDMNAVVTRLAHFLSGGEY